MSAPIAWREAGAADVRGLVALMRAAYRGGEGWAREDHLVRGNRIDAGGVRELLASGVMMVAGDPGRPWACWHVRDLGDGTAGLGAFAVSPTRQAAGTGRAAIAAAGHEAVARYGARRLRIEVLEPHSVLLAYYERRGFHRTGETRPFPADAVHAVPLVPDLRFLVLERPLSLEAEHAVQVRRVAPGVADPEADL